MNYAAVKVTAPTTIHYSLISDTTYYTSNIFYCKALSLIRCLPVDLLQLHNCVEYFDFCFKFIPRVTYEIFSFPSEFFVEDSAVSRGNFSEYLNLFNVKSKVHVFIIDAAINSHNNIAKFLSGLEMGYFIVLPSVDISIYKESEQNHFESGSDLISLFKRDISLINKSIISNYQTSDEVIEIRPDLPINPNKTFLESNNPPGCNLAHNNYYMLNQLIGNIWLHGTKSPEESTLTSQRTQELIDQSQMLDNVSMMMYNMVGVKTLDPFQPLLPSLVLIFPYHFPHPEKIYGRFTKREKLWDSIRHTEQNLEYLHEIDQEKASKVTQHQLRLIMMQNSIRVTFLDLVGFIHARFQYSPVIRLPQLGKSINMVLSHLENITPKKSSTISNIEKFGRELKKLTISDSMAKYISERNGQIFTISDLPIEWLWLDNYPLCYTHDICRIPEFNLNAIMNSAIHMQRLPYEIPSDLINKTLIIHCGAENDRPLNQMFDLIDHFKPSLGFESVRCSSINDIKDAITNYRPELLIFDCHGGANKKKKSTYLVIDNEKQVFLSGDDIIEHRLSAPLVLLSACKTMPNYGYVKLLSDAFMQAGAHCVTTTFLPIKIVDAATLIVRLLHKLSAIKKNAYHNNWLNFIAHVLRTTLIHETVKKARRNIVAEITDEEVSMILVKTMRFETRIEALKELDQLIMEKSSNKNIKFSDLNNEWLSYSIIGRADLVYFASWLKDYRNANLAIET